MNERPLTWWPASALATAARALDPAWQQWCRDWGLAPAPVGAGNACDAPASLRDLEWTAPASTGASFATTGAPPPDALQSLLFGPDPGVAPSTPPQPIAREVAAIAWRDLQRAIVARFGADGAPGGAASPMPGPWRAWSGAVLMRLPFATETPFEALALFDRQAARSVCEPFGPSAGARQPRSPAPLVPVFGALAKTPLSIRVELDDIELDLGTLETLGIGDVIALGHRLDDSLHVRHAGAGGPERVDVCAALLGCRDGRRAVELVAGPLTNP